MGTKYSNRLGFNPLKKEVVIATYNRDYGWVNELDKEVLITVYRKGDKELFPNEIHLKNVGVDVHTFFYHLYNRYDTLSDVTYFAQDYPLDHVSNYIELVNSNIEYLNQNAIQKVKNNCWFFNTYYNNTIECDNQGQPHHLEDYLNLKYIWDQLFKVKSPNSYVFTPSGHFVITKEHARKIPKEVYKKIVYILETGSNAPWEIERLEPYIFINNINDLYYE
jgi:hypothetical protein